LWYRGARKLVLFTDGFHTTETTSAPVTSLVYEGSGKGGLLHVNEIALNLDPVDSKVAPPNVGNTKDGQIALSFSGKVFAFGTPKSEAENLATAPPPGDDTSLSIRHSLFGWPTWFDVNFMTGQTPTWRRNTYYQLSWRKPNGAKLEMLWRYEQFFYPGDGWTGGMMTRENVTGLVKIVIEP